MNSSDQTILELSKGFQGRWFEKEAFKFLKNKYKFVFNIKHPVDFFCYNEGELPVLVEVKFSKDNYINTNIYRLQYKYATHFLVRTKKKIEFVKKGDFKKKPNCVNILSEKDYLKKYCKQYIKLKKQLKDKQNPNINKGKTP